MGSMTRLYIRSRIRKYVFVLIRRGLSPDAKPNPSITYFPGWFFFVLINAYYGGALTMFFVSEITLPFNTIRDALKVRSEIEATKEKSQDFKIKKI